MATGSRYSLGGYGRGKPLIPKRSPIPGTPADYSGLLDLGDLATMKYPVAKPKGDLDFDGSRIEVEAQKLTRRGMFGSYDKVRIVDSYNSDFAGKVSYMENPNYFCVQSKTMQLWIKKNEMKLHFEIEEEEDDLRLNPEINYADSACAVHLDGKWRRGYVMRTNWPTWPDTAHDYIAEIMLVDSGYYGFERMPMLRELPEKWKRPPPMAYRALLEGSEIYSRGDQWNPNVIKEFRSCLAEGTFTASFRSWNFGAMELKVFPVGHWCEECEKKGSQCSVNEVVIRSLGNRRAKEYRSGYSNSENPGPSSSGGSRALT